MTDDRELRQAFGALGGDPDEPAADILAAMKPRLRRALVARRVGVAALALPMLAGLGLAFAAIDRGGSSSQPVATSGGDGERDDTPVAPEVTPEPTPEAETFVLSEAESQESDDSWTIVIPTPTPTPEGDDSGDPAEIGDPVSTGPESGPAPNPVPTATPSGETANPPGPTPEHESESTPSPTPTSEPTAPGVMTMQFESTGGTIDVEYTSTTIITIELSPAPGYTGEIEEQKQREAKVKFSKPGTKVTVEIHLEEDGLRFAESDD